MLGGLGLDGMSNSVARCGDLPPGRSRSPLWRGALDIGEFNAWAALTQLLQLAQFARRTGRGSGTFVSKTTKAFTDPARTMPRVFSAYAAAGSGSGSGSDVGVNASSFASAVAPT